MTRYPTFGRFSDAALDRIWDAVAESHDDLECDTCCGDHLDCGACDDDDVEFE